MNHLILIIGPTAIGKTALSIQLAQHLNTSVISADSRQFYKEMNIGTAKPTKAEMQGIPHYFLDFLSVKEDYNAGQFELDALQLLEKKLFHENNRIIMTGGSGLYIDAICKGIDHLPGKDEDLRRKLKQTHAEEGLAPLHRQLKALDPDYYEKVDLNNPSRIVRALEVCISSGRSYTSFLTQPAKKRPFNILKVGLEMDREQLYERINRRVDSMIEKGLVEEAKALFPLKGYNALQTVGYSELFDHFEGKHSLEKAIELIKRNSRRYAKRQMTWFKRDKAIHWFQPHEEERIRAFIA